MKVRRERTSRHELDEQPRLRVAADEKRTKLRQLRKEIERFAASLPPLDDSAPLIRADRER